MLVSNAAAQTWQYTGALNTERRLSTINMLQNGTVLITGGDDMAGNALASCEIYDPATALWTYAAPMMNTRERHTSNELPDGRIVIIGGNTENIYESIQTGSVEIYSPSTNTWTNGGPLQLARQNHTSTLLNDSLILVCGGFTANGCTSECEIYNVNTMTSTVATPMFQLRHDHAAILLPDGTVLIAGGRTGGSSSEYLAECEIYNPSTNSWTIAPPMPQTRIAALTALFSDSSILIAGGRKDDNDPAEAADIYAPGAPIWTSVDTIMVPSAWQGGTVIPSDRLLMTGGIIGGEWADPSGQSAVNTATCEWYDKPNERWFFAPTMNVTRAEHGAVTLMQTVNPNLPTQMVLVAGGITSPSNVTNTCEVLDVGSSALTHYMEQPQNVASVTGTSVANAMQVVYGENGPYVNLTLAENENVATELVSIDGRVVFNINESLASGEHVLNMPTTLSPGTYLLRVSLGGSVMSSKILITQ